MAFNILWVDDNIEELRSHVMYLGEKGYTISGVTNGQDALAILRERNFDGILLDVPCSNTGVLRRRPDARWRFDPDRLGKTAALQRALLNRMAALLTPGGRMVYSTCSLEPEENEEQIAQWLQEHPEFTQRESRSCFPPESQTDGAFAVAIERI